MASQEAGVIRVLLAYRGALVRGSLAFVLDAEDDIEVVAEVGQFSELVDAVLADRPTIIVLDLDLLPRTAGRSSATLPGLWALRRTLVSCKVLLLAEARKSAPLEPVMAGLAPGLGFIATDGPPSRLVAAVRKVASDEPVLDPDLVVSVLRAHAPLTPREAQVLGVAAEGVPVREIAERLVLSPGTVRNYLSRVLRKTGARTRIEAVRIAQDSGWI
jgi:two-component system response regulator DesR